MRAQLLVTTLVAIGVSASASAQMARPVPMTPTYPVVIAPMPVPQAVPAQSPTLTPSLTPTLTPTPTLPPAPTIAPAPAPAVALAPGGSPGGSCKTTDDCIRETTQCLANKLATHDDEPNATRFYVSYQNDGTPAVFYPVEQPPTDQENAEAAECADELRACLLERCGR
jgi:hypothetical protein